MNLANAKLDLDAFRQMTLRAYTSALDIKDGLACLPLRPFLDQEWEQLPHDVMTSDSNWDPTVLDNHISNGDTWIKDVISITPRNNKVFEQFGNYNQCTIATYKSLSDPIFFDANLFDKDYLHFFDADTFDNHDHDEVILQCMEHAISSAKETNHHQHPGTQLLVPET